MTIRITGGSEAQNERASTIAAYWLARLDLRIADAAEAGGEDRYQANLARARVNMLAGFSQATAQQVINVHRAGIDAATVAIDEAWATR
jgi:N-acetylglucosamine-6-phosphate deacetylase